MLHIISYFETQEYPCDSSITVNVKLNHFRWRQLCGNHTACTFSNHYHSSPPSATTSSVCSPIPEQRTRNHQQIKTRPIGFGSPIGHQPSRSKHRWHSTPGHIRGWGKHCQQHYTGLTLPATEPPVNTQSLTGQHTTAAQSSPLSRHWASVLIWA